MAAGDNLLKKLWSSGSTLEVACAELSKSPTSIAHKLVRLGFHESRKDVNEENIRRGGKLSAKLEVDGNYTIYLIRSPITNAPIYVGQSQNFINRRKKHIKRFLPIFGVEPLFIKIDQADNYREARNKEQIHIAAQESLGYLLFNILDRDEC